MDPYHFDFTINTGVTATNYDDGVNDIYRAYKDYVQCYTCDDSCVRFNEWVFALCFAFEQAIYYQHLQVIIHVM